MYLVGEIGFMDFFVFGACVVFVTSGCCCIFTFLFNCLLVSFPPLIAKEEMLILETANKVIIIKNFFISFLFYKSDPPSPRLSSQSVVGLRRDESAIGLCRGERRDKCDVQ